MHVCVYVRERERERERERARERDLCDIWFFSTPEPLAELE